MSPQHIFGFRACEQEQVDQEWPILDNLPVWCRHALNFLVSLKPRCINTLLPSLGSQPKIIEHIFILWLPTNFVLMVVMTTLPLLIAGIRFAAALYNKTLPMLHSGWLAGGMGNIQHCSSVLVSTLNNIPNHGRISAPFFLLHLIYSITEFNINST